MHQVRVGVLCAVLQIVAVKDPITHQQLLSVTQASHALNFAWSLRSGAGIPMLCPCTLPSSGPFVSCLDHSNPQVDISDVVEVERQVEQLQEQQSALLREILPQQARDQMTNR